MAGAQFCAICGDIISDGCPVLDADGNETDEINYSPCQCDTATRQPDAAPVVDAAPSNEELAKGVAAILEPYYWTGLFGPDQSHTPERLSYLQQQRRPGLRQAEQIVTYVREALAARAVQVPELGRCRSGSSMSDQTQSVGYLLCIDDGEYRWFQAVYLARPDAEHARAEAERVFPGITLEILDVPLNATLDAPEGAMLVMAEDASDPEAIPVHWDRLEQEDYAIAEDGCHIFRWVENRLEWGDVVWRVGE